MKELRRQIIISKAKADKINRLLKTEPKTQSECYGEDEIESYAAKFGDGIEMDIKLCGVQYEEGGCNTPYTEAVLFNYGCEICCTEPAEDFFGIWELEYDGVKYITEVIAQV